MSGNFVALSCIHGWYVQYFFLLSLSLNILASSKFKIGVLCVSLVFEMCVIRISVGRRY